MSRVMEWPEHIRDGFGGCAPHCPACVANQITEARVIGHGDGQEHAMSDMHRALGEVPRYRHSGSAMRLDVMGGWVLLNDVESICRPLKAADSNNPKPVDWLTRLDCGCVWETAHPTSRGYVCASHMRGEWPPSGDAVDPHAANPGTPTPRDVNS